jgi:copper transport protein
VIRRWRGATVLAALAAALVVPASAFAHAYLVQTVPAAAAILSSSPATVALTYDEAVEPRFASISVTNPTGRQLTTGPVSRSPANPDTLVVAVRSRLPQGWYLVYWRAISVDGHPVQGAFTFAVGPLPGVPPAFKSPSASQSATTPRVVIARWLALLSVMAAIGLFALRVAVARPLPRLVPGASLRALTVAFAATTVLALISVPVYVDIATAVDALRSPFAVGALVPLFRVTAFGRAWLDLELCLALFAAAATVAIWVDRPERALRSVAELLALTGACVAAAGVLVIPGLAGHAAQTSPRGVSLLLDWVHLVSGSAWLGGLIGLLVLACFLPAALRSAGVVAAAVRFSPVALASVTLLLASGVGAAVIHLPILAALWQTSYGIAILVKSGLVVAAIALASLHAWGHRPRLAALGAEAVLITGAVLAAAILSSLPPPAAALAEESQSLASVGPGPVQSTLHVDGYTLQVLVTPNTAIRTNSFALRITKNGSPIRGADVTLDFAMLDMEMGNVDYQLAETSPGVYVRPASALVMAGRWGLEYTITPKHGVAFHALVVDHTTG